MQEPKSNGELTQRLNKARNAHQKRDQLVQLVREMYEMKKDRTSTYLGTNAGTWRTKVPVEYWEASNRPHNVVDVMTSVLSGNAPQYQASIPGNVTSAASSRAEKFLTGVWRINSRRQMLNLEKEVVFRTTLDGGVAIRIYWQPGLPNPRFSNVEAKPDPENEQGAPWIVRTYQPSRFPIIIDTIPIDQIYTSGRGVMGNPFDQLYHVQSRSANEIIYEWEGAEDVDLGFLNDLTEETRENKEEYVEWWGQKPDGEVWFASTFKQKWIKPPAPINYPMIPYILTTFKAYNRNDPSLARLPFLFPILWAVDKDEYVSSRIFRLVDLYANLPPVHRGNTPLNMSGTWGEIANLAPDEKLEFPTWPGNPPDVYRLQEELRGKQEQGTFSSAMFGQPSSRMSGYGLSQLIGSDSVRTDTPRSNLELAFAAAAELIFALMQVFSPEEYLAVTAQVQNRKLASMLSGNETKSIVIDAFVQPKQMSDKVRLAALGAQLASLPNAPVSNSYILENYFQIAQPEDEQDKKLAEETAKDPIFRMISLLQVLKDNSHPLAALVEQQLSQAIQQATNPQGAAAPPTDPNQMAGLGLGLPQTTMGNDPIIPASGQPGEEAGWDRSALMNGGPLPAEMQ